VQSALGKHAIPDLCTDRGRRSEAPGGCGDVEKGLVERERLDQGRVFADDGEDRRRRGAVASGIAECTPKTRTSYDAALTTPRATCARPSPASPPPTISGLPRSSGRRSCSTDA
jgi:hypothetical protein